MKIKMPLEDLIKEVTKCGFQIEYHEDDFGCFFVLKGENTDDEYFSDLKNLFNKVIHPLKYTLDQIGYCIDRSFEEFIWVRNVVNGNALRFKDETGVEKWIPEYIYIKEIYPFMTEPYIANFSFLFYIAKKEGCTITPYKDKDPEYKNRNYIKISFKNDFIISNELDCLHQFIVKVKNKKNQEEYKNKLLTEAYEHVMSDENMESRLTDVYEHVRQKKIKKGDLK